MDKNKVKEALKKKLRQEMSMTGTGASVTPGAGEGVATKYAFGKSDNKGTPKDWKAAPSIPNRPSKAMDYKELWEEPYDKSKIKTNADELARVEAYYKEASPSQKASAEDRMKKLKILVGIEKRTGKQLPVLTYGTFWVDYLKKQGVKNAQELETKLSSKKENINEENIEEAKIIGKTKSGKDIYLNFDNPAHKDFTAADHDDASQALLTGKSAASISPAKKAAARQHFDASKAKQKGLNEENLEEVSIPDNIKKFAQRKGVTNVVNQVARWAEKMGKRIVGGTAIGKNYSTLILDLTHQGGEIRINTDTDEIEINDQDIIDYKSFADAVDSLSEPMNEIDTNGASTDEILTYLQAAKQQGKLSPDAQQVLIQWMNSPGASREEIIKVLKQLTGVHLNENYARFRNETKTRTKPEQFHNAVKEVKKKVNEINRLFEYMNRLQSELKESEGGLKTKKYTESALQQIKEATKQLFFKSTKLK